MSQRLERVREVAKQDKKERFTALLHHVTVDLLKEAFFWLKREAAPGVWMVRRGRAISRTWKPTSPICIDVSTKAPTERCLPNGGISPNLTGDSARWALQPLPRTEVTKKVWEYIRHHGLQDAQNRRNINADDKLQALFGGKKQATMFELTKFINQHLR